MKKNQIRRIGILYLFVILFAGLSQGYVRGSLVIYGDAQATAANIVENLGLFRWGLVLDLSAFILDAVISVLLYQMFRKVNRSMAMVSSALRLIAHPAIGSLNLLNHYLAYVMLGGDGYLTAFGPSELESLSMLFMEAHRYGYLIAGGFFGVHCFLLGILIYRSGFLPKWLGVLLLGSGLGYLAETFGNFAVPGYEDYTALIVGVSAAIGEISFTLWLILKKEIKISLLNSSQS
jgi:hypothetical protein